MKTIIVSLFIAVVMTLAGCYRVESNTKVNRWNCALIEEGMNYNEVKRILGNPTSERIKKNKALGEVLYLGYNSGYYGIDLFLKDKKVYRKKCVDFSMYYLD